MMLSRVSHGFANSEDLTILTQVLHDYCREIGIEAGTPDWEDAGRLLMSIFSRGGECSAEALKEAMGQRYVGKR